MITVAALYQFASFDDPAALQSPLLNLCKARTIKGTILLATEGINGTIAGAAPDIATIVDHVRAMPGCAALDVKYSHAQTMPFYRMKVRLKKEIVTLGVAGIDPARNSGRYVEPSEWNALISDPQTIVIDTRNDFEVRIGSFEGALDPKTKSFSEFPEWFRANRAQFGNKPKVAMFCTGGIRCEKSTAFLRAEGIEDVAHLKGGILRYLETVPESDSLWQGECFVFDQRVSVGHGLALGGHHLCHACRMPLTPQEMTAPAYQQAVQCPYCASARNQKQRDRYAERHKQVTLAIKRGAGHIGEG